MELHTVICCPLGISTHKWCTFHPRQRNLFLPTTSVAGDRNIRYFDIRIMVKPSENHGHRFYDAYFNKRLSSFVRDKKPENNKDRVLITLISYDQVLATVDQHAVVFNKMYLGNKKTSTAYIYILSIAKGEEFVFDLISNDEDERKSCSLKYSTITRSIEVFDWSEENLRHNPKTETIRQWVWRQIQNATYNYLHPFGKRRD